MTSFIRAPLINPNEENVTFLEWAKPPGAHVRRGELVAFFETSKATYELEAEASGYLTLLVEAGGSVKVGQILGALTERPEEAVQLPEEPEENGPTALAPAARRWTKKAELMASRHGLDLVAMADSIRPGSMLTEKDIEAYLSGPRSTGAGDLVDEVYPENRIQRLLVIGGGVGAVQLLDVLTRRPGQRAVAILDDADALQGKSVMGCPVVGKLTLIQDLWTKRAFDAAVLAVNSLPARAELFERFTKQGIPFANVIDPSARILSNVSMGVGNVIMGGVQIGACARVGDNNFLSAYVDLEHHNVLGSHCTFGPGVMTSGEVQIGDRVKFGTGIYIEPRLQIGSDSIVASGAILTGHVPPDSVVKVRTNIQIRPKTR